MKSFFFIYCLSGHEEPSDDDWGDSDEEDEQEGGVGVGVDVDGYQLLPQDIPQTHDQDVGGEGDQGS